MDRCSHNKTGTKVKKQNHENYTAVREKQLLAKQYLVVPKRAGEKKLELIYKNDEGHMELTFKRAKKIMQHNMIA